MRVPPEEPLLRMPGAGPPTSFSPFWSAVRTWVIEKDNAVGSLGSAPALTGSGRLRARGQVQTPSPFIFLSAPLSTPYPSSPPVGCAHLREAIDSPHPLTWELPGLVAPSSLSRSHTLSCPCFQNLDTRVNTLPCTPPSTPSSPGVPKPLGSLLKSSDPPIAPVRSQSAVWAAGSGTQGSLLWRATSLLEPPPG